jgi:hypothetical protein
MNYLIDTPAKIGNKLGPEEYETKPGAGAALMRQYPWAKADTRSSIMRMAHYWPTGWKSPNPLLDAPKSGVHL